MKIDRVLCTVDLDQITENYRILSRLVPENTRLIAVMKADAYGHGAAPVAIALEQEKSLWGFAVAAKEEAFDLRANGITKPILLLGHVKTGEYPELIEAEIRPTLYEEEKAEAFSKAASALHKQGYFHVKLDTGMSRIGMVPDETHADTVKRMSMLPGITVEGIFTHFYAADGKDSAATLAQQKKFTDFLEMLRHRDVNIPITHTGNSAATVLFGGFSMAASRVGIALYGLCPSDDHDFKRIGLRPVMSFLSEVIYVKTVPAGTKVSYGGTYVTAKETRIATVSVGYADGYPRSLSNRGQVLIRGRRCPVIGRVCMDQMMVDVTGLTEVQEGDPVTLIGTDGEETITFEEAGALSGRFNYEFICDINKRVPRLYLHGNDPKN